MRELESSLHLLVKNGPLDSDGAECRMYACWVCWTLDVLFRGLGRDVPRLLFKGGTLLSNLPLAQPFETLYARLVTRSIRESR